MTASTGAEAAELLLPLVAEGAGYGATFDVALQTQGPARPALWGRSPRASNGSMSPVLLVLLALPLPAQAAEAPARPAITIHSDQGQDAEVFYLSIPWGPNTFAAMEQPGESYYNRRSWPFARLVTKETLTLDGTKIAPGNFALVFHPNTPDDAGMSLEVRRIEVAEFLQEGNAMTPTPEGETVWRAPIRFDATEETSPILRVGMASDEDGFRLDVQYGNRRTSKTFLR